MNLTLEKNSEELKSLTKNIKDIFGINTNNASLYLLALTPRFVEAFFNGEKISNERLEFLGDAVIDLIVGQYLFNKFPYKDEGFLTEIRSRIVNTQYLSTIAKDIRLSEIAEKFIPFNHQTPPKNWLGNVFEAFIGAMFLDKGYDFCYNFFINYIANKTFDIENIIEEKQNYKSKLIEYCQKNKLNIEYFSEKIENSNDFKIKIFINNKLKGESIASTIKQGEKEASKIAFENLNKKNKL